MLRYAGKLYVTRPYGDCWNCMLYIHFHLPMSLHYLVKRGCSKFLPNTRFITIRLLRFGVKVNRTYCRDNFLPSVTAKHAQVVLRWFFYVSTEQHPSASRTQHHRFPGARKRREKRVVVYKRLCPCTGYHIEEFWQFWAQLSWQLITLLNKPYFSLLCANSVVR